MTERRGRCQLTLVAPRRFQYIQAMLKKALFPLLLIAALVAVLAAGAWIIVVVDPFNYFFPSQHQPGEAPAGDGHDHQGHDHDSHEGHNH